MTARRAYEGTTVNEFKSLTEIDGLLRKHGVNSTSWTQTPDLIRVEFVWEVGRPAPLHLRINVKVPKQDGAAKQDAERRRLLRVLLNHLKAKLIAVEEGLVEIEHEFLGDVVGQDGETFGSHAVPMIREQLQNGRQPLLLTDGGGRK